MDRSDTAHDRTLACIPSEGGAGMLWLYRDEGDANHVADVEYRDFPGRPRPPVLARKIRAGGLTITLWVVVLDWRDRPVADDGSCSFGFGDRVLLDPVDYPRKKGEVGTITRPHPRGVSGQWGVEWGDGTLHPYPVREESMTRT